MAKTTLFKNEDFKNTVYKIYDQTKEMDKKWIKKEILQKRISELKREIKKYKIFKESIILMLNKNFEEKIIKNENLQNLIKIIENKIKEKIQNKFFKIKKMSTFESISICSIEENILKKKQKRYYSLCKKKDVKKIKKSDNKFFLSKSIKRNLKKKHKKIGKLDNIKKILNPKKDIFEEIFNLNQF